MWAQSILRQRPVLKRKHITRYFPGESALEARQREMSYLFITRFLPFMLDRKDRTSSYVGFEVRVPFCDYRLVEYLWNVPYQVKTVDDIEKGILRRVLKGDLPDDVLHRRKALIRPRKIRTISKRSSVG